MAGGGKYDFDFSDKVVLVVEDNQISFKLIHAVLTQVKANVVHAINGMKAIEACTSDAHFDLVLMDMQMPEVDGLEATRRIKQIRPDLPIVATTANIYHENALACKEAGCDGFLTKPLQFRKMFELMQSLFERQE
ncbi:MAG: response regulator [Bacteroidales bacterium]|nr:response regulator [Bacteroidales bacterium]